MLEGMVEFIKHGKIQDLEEHIEIELEEAPTITSDMGNITYQYCTECIIEGSDINQSALKRSLGNKGDSLIVAGSSSKTKIHIHTNSPREIFHIAEKYGEILSEKADDMRDQFKTVHTHHRDIALVVDTSFDLPQKVIEQYSIHMVPLQVMFGEKSYVDKLSLAPEDFYRLVQTNPDIHPTTSQPSPADFIRKFEYLDSHYNYILGMTLSGALSGTTESARTAVRNAGLQSHAHILDTKTTSVAAGLIARKVAEAVENGTNFKEAIELGEQLISRTKILVTVPSLDSLIRGGRVSKMQGFIADLFNLKPIITLDDGGKAVKKTTVFGVKGGKSKILKILGQELDSAVPVDFAIAHVNALNDASWFQDEIQKRFTTDHDIFIKDASPVLAAHAGFGAVAVAYIYPDSNQ